MKKNNYILIKILRKALFLASFLFLIPFVIIFLTPFKDKVKFIKLRRDVIGNSIEELYLYLNIYKKNKYHYFFFDDSYVCNEYFNKICKKNLKFSLFGKTLLYISKRIKLFDKFIINMPKWYNLNQSNPKSFKTVKEFKFSKKQNNEGKNFLNNIGVKKNQKIICLIIRDNFYKKKLSNDKKRDWSSHNYRNADISSYLKTIKYLNKKGYFVIRMGKGADKAIKYSNPSYFDYARSDLRNDFLDFWIISNAYFCISTGTGVDELCSTYSVPSVDTNFLPIGMVRSAQNTNISIFKKIRSSRNKKLINLSELINNRIFYRQDELETHKNNFYWEDNSPTEIFEATKEMELLLLKKNINTKFDRLNQKKFWDKFNDVKNCKDLYSHGELNNIKIVYENRRFFNSSISNFFLANNSWILK
jgi:putative glycosyltransferase (TIGR04372 family)